MELIVGGAFQGQIEFGKGLFPDICWADGNHCTLEALKNAGGVFDFQELIYRLMKEEALPEDLAEQIYEANPKLIIVTNEVGSGVVPVEAFERNYRETTGRICTVLAEKSDKVYRVICGIGTLIKDGGNHA